MSCSYQNTQENILGQNCGVYYSESEGYDGVSRLYLQLYYRQLLLFPGAKRWGHSDVTTAAARLPLEQLTPVTTFEGASQPQCLLLFSSLTFLYPSG